MSDPVVITTDPMTVAYLPMTGDYAQTPEGLARLYGWTTRHGLMPAGMPTSVYLTPPPENPEDEARWELWAPLAGDVPESGPDASGIGVKTVPPMMAASLMHVGPYDSTPDSYAVLWQWIGANGYVPNGPPMERYYSDPAEVPPEEYVTEILMPVAAR